MKSGGPTLVDCIRLGSSRQEHLHNREMSVLRGGVEWERPPVGTALDVRSAINQNLGDLRATEHRGSIKRTNAQVKFSIDPVRMFLNQASHQFRASIRDRSKESVEVGFWLSEGGDGPKEEKYDQMLTAI